MKLPSKSGWLHVFPATAAHGHRCCYRRLTGTVQVIMPVARGGMIIVTLHYEPSGWKG